MKKLIFGLVATVVFGMSASAQAPTKNQWIKDVTSPPTTIMVDVEIPTTYQTKVNLKSKSLSKNDFYTVNECKDGVGCVQLVVSKTDNKILSIKASNGVDSKILSSNGDNQYKDFIKDLIDRVTKPTTL